MSDQPTTPAATTAPAAKAPRCGHKTSSGPCHRPEGHTANGHASQATLAKKSANARGKDITPEALAEREAVRAAAAQERIAALEVAHAAKITKLEEAAAALGFKLTPLSKAAKAAAAAKDAAKSE